MHAAWTASILEALNRCLYNRMLVREVMRRFQSLLNMLGSSITPLNGKRYVDRASKNHELKIKVALHIQMTPDNNKFNRDIGLEFSGCWLSMLCANHPPGYNKQ